jgi:hypothetical protein
MLTHDEPVPQSMPHELQCAFEFFATHEPLQQYLPEPHEVPCATVRVQVSDCTIGLALHVPAAHV